MRSAAASRQRCRRHLTAPLYDRIMNLNFLIAYQIIGRNAENHTYAGYIQRIGQGRTLFPARDRLAGDTELFRGLLLRERGAFAQLNKFFRKIHGFTFLVCNLIIRQSGFGLQATKYKKCATTVYMRRDNVKRRLNASFLPLNQRIMRDIVLSFCPEYAAQPPSTFLRN